MPEYKIEKQSLPIILNEQKEPIALVFFNQKRDRILYTLKKADEDDIIALFERKDSLVRTKNTNEDKL